MDLENGSRWGIHLIDVDFSSYSIAKWFALQPPIHLLKSIRYRHIDRHYRKQPARAEFLAHPSKAKPNLLISISFEDAELIDWQARLVAAHVPSAEYIVVDNSKSIKGAQAIKAVCTKQGCSYFLTPDNPWYGAPSRSHGLALNWALDNVIKPRRPNAFGFIDADIFPTQLADPFEVLEQQDFFGVVRNVGARWYLWAGFCFFRLFLAERFPLNFGQAWFMGLDTGGANWDVLYKHYDLSKLQQMETSFVPFKSGLEVDEGPFQWCGPWLHEVGQMGYSGYAAEKRRALEELLKPLLAS